MRCEQIKRAFAAVARPETHLQRKFRLHVTVVAVLCCFEAFFREEAVFEKLND